MIRLALSKGYPDLRISVNGGRDQPVVRLGVGVTQAELAGGQIEIIERDLTPAEARIVGSMLIARADSAEVTF